MRRMLRRLRQGKVRTIHLAIMAVVFGGAMVWRVATAQETAVQSAPSAAAPAAEHFQFFSPVWDTAKFTPIEQASLFGVLLVAIAGLVYAGSLVKQIRRADRGTERM